MTPHIGKHFVVYVLQSDIEIAAHVLMAGHRIEHIIWKICRIGIVQTNHFYSRNHRKSVDKLSQTRFSTGQVCSVAREILSDDVEFACAF